MNNNKLKHCCLESLGIINSLGNTHESILEKLTGTEKHFLTERGDLIEDRKIMVGQVNISLPEIPESLKIFNCRNNRLGLAAYLQIKDSVERAIQKYGKSRIGVVLGSSTSGIASLESAMKHLHLKGTLLPEYHYHQSELGTVAQFISRIADVNGPAYTVSTACSSGAKALASARSLIRMDICDAVITGGVDSLCRLTLNGFNVLELISTGISMPMSKNRDGINIGEGAVLFLMSKNEDGIQLRGIGESSDAYHMSAPDPEGRGAETAMLSAIKDAETEPENINYISLHGTGTLLNDKAEAIAINRVFGLTVPCSSTKPMFGHTLGAAGATGAAICYILLAQNNDTIYLPHHSWDNEKDAEIPDINLVSNKQAIPNNSNVLLMSNAFAFGGNNCSIVIGKN